MIELVEFGADFIKPVGFGQMLETFMPTRLMLAEQTATTEMVQQIQLAKLQPEVWLNQTSKQTVFDLQQQELAQVLSSTAAAIQSFAKIRSVVHF